MLRCTACGSSICGRECAGKRWKQHRSECRRLQAVAFGEEYARNDDRSYRMIDAAHKGDLQCVKAYLRDPADAETVIAVLDARLPAIPRVLLHAPLCRDDLLVEFEAQMTLD